MVVACVRHLPTAWNRISRLQGRQDTDVLELDEVSAAAIQGNQESLKQAGPFDAILASSLKRTQQTAALYGFTDFTVEPLLDELDFGRYEGRERYLLAQELPEWATDPRKLVLGEPILSLEARICSFVTKYGHLSNILVFGHGSWFRGLLSVAQYGDVRDMNAVQIENNELVVVKFGSPRPAGEQQEL
jgi:broad specificity phosphatase PhoE